jgi:hypothetical protein
MGLGIYLRYIFISVCVTYMRVQLGLQKSFYILLHSYFLPTSRCERRSKQVKTGQAGHVNRTNDDKPKELECLGDRRGVPYTQSVFKDFLGDSMYVHTHGGAP